MKCRVGGDSGAGRDIVVDALKPIGADNVVAATNATTGALGRILLVDDESGIRGSVSRYLSRHGFQVTGVAGGHAAIDALRAGQFDAILSDLRMPGLSGEGFYELLAREFPGMTRHIIFTSGDLSEAGTRRFLTRTACPSLQKPYELSELVQTLRSHCIPRGASVEHRATDRLVAAAQPDAIC